MLFALVAAAQAAELTPALALPSAVALEAGGGQAALGAVVSGGATPVASVTLRGAVGITDRLAVSGALREPWGGLLLGLRYNVVETDGFRLAPYAFATVDDDLVTFAPSEARLALAAGVGVALEGGGESFRYDLSLPLVASNVDPLASPLRVPFAGATLGVSVRVASRHVVRVGVESTFAPGITWRYARERWYLQATSAYSLVQIAPVAHAEVGLRF
jgi:hypothetical protein